MPVFIILVLSFYFIYSTVVFSIIWYDILYRLLIHGTIDDYCGQYRTKDYQSPKGYMI